MKIFIADFISRTHQFKKLFAWFTMATILTFIENELDIVVFRSQQDLNYRVTWNNKL